MIRRAAIGIWKAAQTACLIVGMSVAILIAAELVVRGSLALRRMMSRSTAAAGTNPLASRPWFAEYSREADRAQALVWRPYVYFRRAAPFRGQYINIDSAGHRVTPQPRRAGPPALRVFMFGGSTLWGWFQRDDKTIAAELARRLTPVTDSVGGVEVTNFGETGYVFTQEVLELMLQLRAGNRPDVVVFYDGVNDVASSLQSRAGGFPQNEYKRVEEFDLGRDLDRARYNYAFGKDIRAIGTLGVEALKHMEVVSRFMRLAPGKGPPLYPADSATTTTVNAYVENVRIVEALSKSYGFDVVYMWQPTLYATQKPLSAFEKSLKQSIDADTIQTRLQQIHRAAPPLLDAALTPMVGSRFIDGANLFQHDTAEVYADRTSHMFEEAVPSVVDAMWPQIYAAIQHQLSTRKRAPRAKSI